LEGGPTKLVRTNALSMAPSVPESLRKGAEVLGTYHLDSGAGSPMGNRSCELKKPDVRTIIAVLV